MNIAENDSLSQETLEKNKAAILAFEKQDWDPFYDYQSHHILLKQSIDEIFQSFGSGLRLSKY